MMRILFWLGVLVLVVLAVRSKLRSLAPKDPPPSAAPGGGGSAIEGEAMTSCAHCHMYFPASEAVRADGLEYCSPAHVRLPAQ